jgi:hypothetical protein
MKKLISISLIFLLCSCIFTYDPPRGLLYIRNNSDEAVYVYRKCGNVDSLPLYPKLELFYFSSMNMKDAHGNIIEPHFDSPEYRINAYTYGSLQISGTPNNPRLPCKNRRITLFFITEKNMRNCNWEEIYKNQLYIKRVVLTEDELKSRDWKYTYSPDSTMKELL